jgi:hypothetical protein
MISDILMGERCENRAAFDSDVQTDSLLNSE